MARIMTRHLPAIHAGRGKYNKFDAVGLLEDEDRKCQMTQVCSARQAARPEPVKPVSAREPSGWRLRTRAPKADADPDGFSRSQGWIAVVFAADSTVCRGRCTAVTCPIGMFAADILAVFGSHHENFFHKKTNTCMKY